MARRLIDEPGDGVPYPNFESCRHGSARQRSTGAIRRRGAVRSTRRGLN
jgi:hypothetical protein